jgi:N-acetylglucosaminyl-diphospho-decaprenol L-rhamnosyltransferase
MAADPSRLDGLGDVMAGPGFPFRGGYTRPDPGACEIGEVFSPCGGAMLVRRDLFLELGGFDERLFCYCEDVDFGYRLRLAGEPTLVVPDAVVLHEGSASTGGPRSDFAVFHGTRNRLWVFVKDTPPALFWLTLPLHALTTAVLFARHATRGELAAPWRGLKAGVAGLSTALAMRREAQARRKVGSLAIARAMTWNPLDLFLRRVVIRRLVRPLERPTRSAGA